MTTLSSRLAVQAVCLLAIVGCASPHLETRESFGQGPPARRDDTQLADLRTTLGRAGISLDLGGTTSAILSTSCREALADRVQPSCVRCELASETYPIDDKTLDAAKRTFDLYPTDFLTASGITGVALCSRLMYVDIRPDPQLSRLMYVDIRRGPQLIGTVDLHAGLLLISLEPFVHDPYDPATPFTIDGVIHHELFHQLEFDRMRSAWADDPEWRLHNPIGFDYKDREPDARPLGFVSTYAATNAWEDRATVFEWIMTKPDALCVIAAADPVVRDKVELVWERVTAIAGDRFLRRRAPCVDWIDRPATPTPAPQGEPVHRDPSFRNPSLVDQQWLRPPSR